MIASAAVKIYDKRQNVIVTIPCHRHADAFQILRDFGYRRFIDYNEVAQGFLDENDNFLSRIEAKKAAQKCGQLNHETETQELYSEDLWQRRKIMIRGVYRANARSLLGVMYAMTDFNDEMYLVNETEDGEFPFAVDKYRV